MTTITRLPLPDFNAFVERLDQRGYAQHRAGNTERAMRIWRAVDRLILRRAARA